MSDVIIPHFTYGSLVDPRSSGIRLRPLNARTIHIPPSSLDSPDAPFGIGDDGELVIYNDSINH